MSLTFSNIYQATTADDQATINFGAAISYTITEAVADDTYTVGEQLTITRTDGTSFDGTYVGSTASGEVIWNYTTNGANYILTDATYNNGDVVNFTATDLVVCFARGTKVETATGLVAVEDLKVGDLVKTRDNGLQPVRWIGQRAFDAAALKLQRHLAPVRIAAGALGNSDALTVSPEHRMLVTGDRAEILFGAREVLVAAKALINGDTIAQIVPAEGVEYFHVMFDTHEVILAEGCWSESFNPDATALSSLTADSRDELLAIFPELGDAAHIAPARPVAAKAAHALLA